MNISEKDKQEFVNQFVNKSFIGSRQWYKDLVSKYFDDFLLLDCCYYPELNKLPPGELWIIINYPKPKFSIKHLFKYLKENKAFKNTFKALKVDLYNNSPLGVYKKIFVQYSDF